MVGSHGDPPTLRSPRSSAIGPSGTLAPEKRTPQSATLAVPLLGLQRVLVCLDGTDLCERALPLARALCHTWQVPLTLMHVVEPRRRPGDPTPWDALDWEVARAEGRAYLTGLCDRAADWGLELEMRLPEGHAPEQILSEACQEREGLTVLSTRGDLDPSGWRLGVTTQMVVSRATGSLLVVPPQAMPEGQEEARIRRVGVALDGSLRAEAVLPVAGRIARDHGARVILVHVVKRPEISCPAYATEEALRVAERLEGLNAQAAEHYLAQLRGRLEGEGVQVETLLQHEVSVEQELTKTAVRQRLDLLVLSAHGRTGSAHSPYGATTRHMIGDGLVPLLILQDERGWNDRDVERPAAPLPSREEVR